MCGMWHSMKKYLKTGWYFGKSSYTSNTEARWRIMSQWTVSPSVPETACHLTSAKRLLEPWLPTLQWRHDGCDGVSNHQPHRRLLNRYSGAHQRKHQSSASLAFVRGIHRWTVNSPPKWPVTRNFFPLDDVIMRTNFGEIWIQTQLDSGSVLSWHHHACAPLSMRNANASLLTFSPSSLLYILYSEWPEFALCTLRKSTGQETGIPLILDIPT